MDPTFLIQQRQQETLWGCDVHHTKEQAHHRGLWVFLIRMLFSEGRTQSQSLCNASVTTKPGGRKSHCLLSDLPLGWNSESLSLC